MAKRPPDHLPDSAIDRARLTAEQLRAGYPQDGRKPWARGAQRSEHRTAKALPPLGNTGGKGRMVELVASDGRVLEIPARRGWGGSAAFIDWLNVTVDESTFYWGDNGVPVTDHQVIVEVSVICESIFGFGITRKRDHGANFYRQSYELGEGMGLVCYGGQRDTVLISLSGEGCAGAKEGWEKRLHDFLKERGVRTRITRVDLAHDDYDGKVYSVDKAVADYDVGLFNCGGRNPDIEQRGNWKKPNGKGRTVYIGNRKNGKFLRVYEKGRQLGAPDSEWVRIEGELKSVDREIPLDVLLEPGAYLAALYPALAFLQQRQERIKCTQREAASSYKKMLDWLRVQCGAALSFASEIEGGAEAVLSLIGRPKDFPKCLKGLRSWESAPMPIHRVPEVPFAPGRFVQLA